MLGGFGEIAFTGGSDRFDLQTLHVLQRHPFEERPARGGEVMLHRIAEGEEAASRAFQTVPKRDQLLPAIDRDPPIVTESAFQLLGILHSQIGHVAIRPDEGMERLHFHGRAAIFAAPINPDGPGVAQLDRHDSRSRIGTEEERVVFESHRPDSATSTRMTTTALRVPVSRKTMGATALPVAKPEQRL